MRSPSKHIADRVDALDMDERFAGRAKMAEMDDNPAVEPAPGSAAAKALRKAERFNADLAARGVVYISRVRV